MPIIRDFYQKRAEKIYKKINFFHFSFDKSKKMMRSKRLRVWAKNMIFSAGYTFFEEYDNQDTFIDRMDKFMYSDKISRKASAANR